MKKLLFGVIVDQEDIKSKQNWIELLDRDKLAVSQNDSSPIMNDCRLGRFMIKQNWIELLDRDKLVVEQNDLSPVSNDCRLGRFIVKQNWIELLDKDKLVV